MIRDILQMNNVKLIYKNFSGEPSKFNREGDRNFAVVIDDPLVAQQLAEDGWNIKVRAPRDEDEQPLHYLKVKVSYNPDYPKLDPNIYLQTGKKLNRLDAETINMLDDVYISDVELDIRPYNYEVNGKTGVTAYVQSMKVTQEIKDRFRKDYDEQE